MSHSSRPATLIEALLDNAIRYGTQAAFEYDDSSICWEQAAGRIASSCETLTDLGVSKGDYVVLFAGNHPDFAFSYFSVHALGATAILLDADIKSQNLIAQAASLRPVLAVGSAANVQHQFRTINYEDIASKPLGGSVSPRCKPEDRADILFTSGSTGMPKGVVLTQANIFAAARQINSVVCHKSADRELVSIPLSHSFGLGRLRCMALTGNTLILDAGIRDLASMLFRLLRSKATGLALVPSGFDLLRRLTRDRLKDSAEHLEYIEIGSARMSTETSNWLRDMLPNTRIYHHYGMTEASRAVFFDFGRDHGHLNSIGLPSPGVTVTVEDDNGQSLPPGEVGEFVISGPMVMSSYLGQTPAPENSMFRSGDMGYQDTDGYLYHLGRKDNVANVGGRQVACAEIEIALANLPEIQEAACFGVSDPDGILGEILMAFVVASPELELAEVKSSLRRDLEAYKIPTYFNCIDVLPKTANGKIDYPALRAKEIQQ